MTNLKRKCIIIAILTGLMAALGGCGGRDAGEEFNTLRERLLSAGSVSITAELTADRGDTVEDYTLRAVARGEETSVEVMAPELLSGVRARINKSGGALEYGGTSLAAGNLGIPRLSPISALPELINALAFGYVDSVWREDGMIAVRLIPEDELEITVYMDGSDLLPAAAELMRHEDGKVVISCKISEFTVK